MPLELPKEGFARPAQVAFYLGVSRTTVYDMVRDGRLPAPLKMGTRVTVWPVKIIRALQPSPSSFHEDSLLE